jgi:hypothetical protein
MGVFMLLLNKKRIYIILSCLLISVIAFQIRPASKEASKETVALPVNKKVIVLDAGHGRRGPVVEQLRTHQRQI